MKLTAELDISAITVAKDEMLILVIPTAAAVPQPENEPDWQDPLMQDLLESGIENVFILYCDGVQMAKVKR